MDRWMHALLFVLAGTVLGLAHPMLVAGPGLFVEVWTASLLGDLLFVAGMVATYLAARNTPGGVAVITGLLGVWLTYVVAWMVTGGVMAPDEAGTQAFDFVVRWGWAGIVGCGLWPWVQRGLEEKAAGRAEAPVPVLENTPRP